MNIFRFFGDLSHLVAVIILLLKIWKTRSCSGISGKSQVLFAVVFTCRYLDLFTDYVSFYNTVMKIIFIASSYTTVYLIYQKFKTTYGRSQDTFRIEYLLGVVAFLTLLIHERRPNAWLVMELLWTFSIYLEAFAILPQLFMITRTGEAETITSHYLFFLGLYRGLYILNWIYRYYTEGFHEWIPIISGTIQTILYCDFFYLYITRGKCKPSLDEWCSLVSATILIDDMNWLRLTCVDIVLLMSLVDSITCNCLVYDPMISPLTFHLILFLPSVARGSSLRLPA